MTERVALSRIKAKKAQLENKRKELIEGLPFLYGHKWYAWQRAFWNSTNREEFITAANQIGKSQIQIWKKMYRATAVDKWPELWRARPDTFWYLYPTQDIVNQEWRTKWLPWMPRGIYKDHPTCGWKLDASRNEKEVHGIHWNSGIYMEFKTYAQNAHALQAGSIDDIGCFPAGTPIVAKTGIVPIESIKVGDLVLSDAGWKPVTRVMSREADVVTRRFSNGTEITATPNHPFWTRNRGWVPFGSLQTDDVCATVPAWTLIKKLFYSRASSTSGIRKTRTIGRAITSAQAKAESIFTWLFGSGITAESCPRGSSFIMRTSTPSTIASETYRFSRSKSIPVSISGQSGSKPGYTNAPVQSAGESSRLAALSSQCVTALWNAVAAMSPASASFAGKASKAASICLPARVLSDALSPSESTTVINLTVSDSHTYFADGLLVHNCDEEMPEELWDEINQRRKAKKGYFSMVFTATRNQQFWRRVMECKGELELIPEAFKLQITKYDCLLFDDGSLGLYTEEEIAKEIKQCRSQAEIDRRIFGKFVTEEGRKYPTFDPAKHYVKPFKIPPSWPKYAGVDVGAGGGKNHPAAIYFIAVQPDYRKGYVYKGWRGDTEQTTAGDVLTKFILLRGSDVLVEQRYDYHSKDFGTIAERSGEPFLPADKSHERGEEVINTLFANGMLFLFDDDPEIQKVGSELMTLMKDTDKRSAIDDGIDATRYGTVTIPWDWNAIQGRPTDDQVEAQKKAEESRPLTAEEKRADEIRQRRGDDRPKETDEWSEFREEIEEWNDLYGS